MTKQHIKKTALLVGAAVLLSGAATLSVRHYQNYKVQHDKVVAAEQAREAAEDKERIALKADVQVLAKIANDNRISCEKGLAAYNTLTAFQKTKAALPVCSAVVVR